MWVGEGVRAEGNRGGENGTTNSIINKTLLKNKINGNEKTTIKIHKKIK